MIKLIKFLEDFLFNLALWLLILPKTFVKIIMNPTWAATYIPDELSKEPDEQFDQYISPPLMIILCPVLITYLYFKAENYKLLTGFSVEEYLTILSYVVIILPLIYSFLYLKLLRAELSRKNLKPLFYIQCYYFSVVLFVPTIGNVMDSYVDLSPYLLLLFPVLSILLWIYFQFIYIRHVFEYNRLKTLIYTLTPIVLVALLSIVRRFV